MNDQQREKMRQVRIKQAIRKLAEIEARQSGLINGNFTAVAKSYDLRVKELRSYWTRAKEMGLVS